MIVIPSVSLGNVPQLALDLLCHTFGFELVKTLDDTYLCPFIGPMDYKSGDIPTSGIATACQLFKYRNIYLVQLRSPPLSGFKTKFIQNLKSELKDFIDENGVIVVGSAFAGTAEYGLQGTITETQSTAKPMEDSGFVNEALEGFENSTAIISWVHEGDNSLDAVNMARVLINKLALSQPEKLAQPVSWSKLYGKNAPIGVENGLYT